MRLTFFTGTHLLCGLPSLSNALLTTASTVEPIPFRENRFLHWLCAGMALAIAISAYRPESVYDWFLENTLVFTLLVTLAATYRRLTLSNLSYLLLLVYLSVHEWGAHYKYSDVPLGEWMKPWLATQRNDYDRVIHFCYGLLCGYPMQEFFMRKLNVTSRWKYYLPVESILALSAVYELLEAMMANILTPERGEEFVGMQGDIWDSQKDMLMATLGAISLMVILAVVRHRRAAIALAKAQEPALAFRAHR
jgi:putative membrane protein